LIWGSVGSPFPANTEHIKLFIIADQCQVFVDRLRSDHAIEGVFVLRRETAGAKSVLEADGQR
jgi:hypothetical protein